MPAQPSSVISLDTLTILNSVSLILVLPTTLIAPLYGSNSLIVPLPLKFNTPPLTLKTVFGADISFPFKLILTVLLIEKVSLNDELFNKVITSLLLLESIASSNVL